MTYPNSPAEPYPEAFGWPWHGLISLEWQKFDEPFVTLPSGAQMPITRFGSCDTHLFDAGMPPSTLTAEEDQAWWNKAILRGSEGLTAWGGGAFVPTVAGGQPYLLDYWPVATDLSTITIYCSEWNGTTWQPYPEVTVEYPANHAMAVIWAGSGIGWQISVGGMVMRGGAGERALYPISITYVGGGLKTFYPAGYVEVIVDPVSKTSSGVFHGAGAASMRLITDTFSPKPDGFVEYRSNGDGDPIILPSGQPKPNFYTQFRTWHVGAASAITEIERVACAWYKQNGAVEVIYAGLRIEDQSSGSMNASSYISTQTLKLGGRSVATLVTQSSKAYLSSPPRASYGFTITLNGTLYDSFSEVSGNYTSMIAPAGQTGLTVVGDIKLSTVADGRLIVATTGRMLSNTLATSLLDFYDYSDESKELHQLDALSPSGWDNGTHIIIGALTEAENWAWLTGSWNPVTGQVARASKLYRYSWV